MPTIQHPITVLSYRTSAQPNERWHQSTRFNRIADLLCFPFISRPPLSWNRIISLLSSQSIHQSMSDSCCCAVCVRTQEVGVVENLGEFQKLLHPGLHCIKWPLEGIVGRMSLRIQVREDRDCGDEPFSPCATRYGVDPSNRRRVFFFVELLFCVLFSKSNWM